MLQVTVENGSRLHFTDPKLQTGFTITFQRTLRIPDDGKTYPLPPGLGTFPIRRVHAYKDRVPASWVKTSGVFIPMYQREALWIAFGARYWRPNAVKIAAGKVNAVSGKPWDQTLHAPTRPGMLGRITGANELQDYLTCPPQPWLDGFNTGAGKVRQFVAMPLGMGYTVEAQVTGQEEHGGLQIIVYEPKAGRFPETPPPREDMVFSRMEAPAAAPIPRAARSAGREMGLGAGGEIIQKIYPDPHGIDTWDEANFGRAFVHIVNSMMWREITGEEPPPTPITAQSYTQAGFPWFKLYDEGAGDVAPAPALSGIKSIAQMDAQHGFVGVDDDSSVAVPDQQVKGLTTATEVPEGEW